VHGVEGVRAQVEKKEVENGVEGGGGGERRREKEGQGEKGSRVSFICIVEGRQGKARRKMIEKGRRD